MAMLTIALLACSEQGVTVHNASPEADIVSHDDMAEVEADVAVVYHGYVSDPDHDVDELTAAWFVDDNQVCNAAVPNADGTVACEITLEEGEWTIRLDVRDSGGGGDSALLNVIAVSEPPPNEAPSCAITSPKTNAFSEEGEEVAFTGSASDDAGATTLTVLWESDRDGPLSDTAPDSSGALAFATSTLSAGTHTITLTVDDTEGERCTDSIVYSVGSPPSLTVLSPADGETYTEGEAITFATTMSDGQDAATDLEVVWSVDGAEFAREPGDSTGAASFDWTPPSWGSSTYSARVTDSDGLYAQVDVDLTVNGVPDSPEITLGPADPTTTDLLQVSIDTDAVDPEGGTLTYTYAWSVDGAAHGETGSSIAAVETTKGETWTVTVTAADELGAEGPAATASVTVLNTPPTRPALVIDPDEPLPGESLQCELDTASTDDDGDAIRYAATWTVDGVAYSGSTTLFSGDTVPAGVTVDGETWTCTVTPSDDEAEGDSGTASVDVACEKLDWYDDDDGDGYGDPDALTEACEQPAGTVADDSDCDDTADEVSPDATEWCDEIDNDCDDDIDEDNAADALTWYADDDADGYGDADDARHACEEPTGYVADATDCDDTDATTYPWAGDVMGDGTDSDCDGLDCEAASDGTTYFTVCFDDLGWHDGRADCQDAGHDDLASIEDASEQAFVETLIDDAGGWESEAPYIGYADEVIESSWGWSNGSTSTWTNWSTNEPNGGSSENCAQLNWPLGTGEWNDTDCYGTSADRGYVCERR